MALERREPPEYEKAGFGFSGTVTSVPVSVGSALYFYTLCKRNLKRLQRLLIQSLKRIQR